MKKPPQKISARRRAAPPFRPKLRPRGKSFAKGNQYGKATRFKPGQSGNPGGKPSTAKISEAMRFLLGLELSELKRLIHHPPDDTTGAIGLAIRAMELALRKKQLGAIAEICDRTEGRPRVSIDVERGDPLAEMLQEMRNMSAEAGRPEGLPSADAELVQ